MQSHNAVNKIDKANNKDFFFFREREMYSENSDTLKPRNRIGYIVRYGRRVTVIASQKSRIYKD